MKKEVNFKTADGKDLKLSLNIRDLRQIEREVDCSLYALMTDITRGALRNMSLDFDIAILRHALPYNASEKDAEEIIEQHYLSGGTLDDINQAMLNVLLASGAFTPGKVEEAAEKK